MAKFDKSMEYISQTQTLIGQQRKRLVDQDTGEVIEVDQITKRALGQKQFWKIYLMDFLQVLGGFEYKQLDVLITFWSIPKRQITPLSALTEALKKMSA